MSGVKRDARDLDVREREPAAQRARYERPQGAAFEGVPAGPRNPGMTNGNMRRDGGRRGESIFDRVQGGGGHVSGAGNAGFDAVGSQFSIALDLQADLCARSDLWRYRGCPARRTPFRTCRHPLCRSRPAPSSRLAEPSSPRTSSGPRDGAGPSLRSDAGPADRVEQPPPRRSLQRTRTSLQPGVLSRLRDRRRRVSDRAAEAATRAVPAQGRCARRFAVQAGRGGYLQARRRLLQARLPLLPPFPRRDQGERTRPLE